MQLHHSTAVRQHNTKTTISPLPKSWVKVTLHYPMHFMFSLWTFQLLCICNPPPFLYGLRIAWSWTRITSLVAGGPHGEEQPEQPLPSLGCRGDRGHLVHRRRRPPPPRWDHVRVQVRPLQRLSKRTDVQTSLKLLGSAAVSVYKHFEHTMFSVVG